MRHVGRPLLHPGYLDTAFGLACAGLLCIEAEKLATTTRNNLSAEECLLSSRSLPPDRKVTTLAFASYLDGLLLVGSTLPVSWKAEPFFC